MTRPRTPLSDDDFHLLRLLIAGWNDLRVGKTRFLLGPASLDADTLAVLMPFLSAFRVLLDDLGIRIKPDSATNQKAIIAVAQELRRQTLQDLRSAPTGALGHIAVHQAIVDETAGGSNEHRDDRDDDAANQLWTDPERLFHAVREEARKLSDNAPPAAIRRAIVRGLNRVL